MADLQSFTPLQSRRLPQAVLNASLCPSMDLIALGVGGGRSPSVGETSGGEDIVASSVVVHRTVSWQKLLTVQKSDLSSQNASEDEGVDSGGGTDAEDITQAEAPPSGASALCWSPDGRTIVLGLADGGLAFFDTNASAGGGGKGGGGDSGNGAVRFMTPAPFVASILREADPGDGRSNDGDTTRAKRKNVPPAHYATSPAVTRSRAAAMRRQQILKAASDAGSNLGGAEEEKTEVPPRSKKGSVMMDHPKVSGVGWRRGSITGLTWSKIGPRHRLWELDEEEEENEEFWRHRCHYVDRAKHFLPPCDYNPRPENGENQPPHHDISIITDDASFSAIDKSRPTSETPLSVLCVATCGNGLHLYLHGRYRLLSIPPENSVNDIETDMVCTSDLGTILLSSKTTSPTGHRLAIYSVHSLPRNRYDLQQISALHCSVTTHLQTMRKGMTNASASWASALRPLDMKFESLAKLLRDYGVLDAATAGDCSASATGVRTQLLRFALEGHSSQNVDASNAMDQFFAAATMNDQLLVRLERTLEANLAGVEGTLRKSVLGPLRALVHDAHELRGLSSAMGAGRTKVWEEDYSDDDSSCCDCAPLLDVQMTRCFCDTTENLFELLERCLSMLVDARFRLRDIMKWIRGTASQVKARGTAVDSVMRENARKRRVPDSVIKRVSGFLSCGPKKIDEPSNALRNANLTEQVLGVPLSVFFSDQTSSSSDASPLTRQHNIPNKHVMNQKRIFCSALSALGLSSQLAADLFDQPRKILSQTVERLDILHSCNSNDSRSNRRCSFAVHRRVGAGIRVSSTNLTPKCFCPKLSQSGGFHAASERHWTLVAYSRDSGPLPVSSDSIQLVAIPSGPNFGSGKTPPYFLLSSMMLPRDITVSDLQFYGDDGCSALTSGSDVKEHEEGRQALGVLVERAAVNENAVTSEELWMLPYDDLPFNIYPCGVRSFEIPDVNVDSCCHITITDGGALITYGDMAMNIRRRQIRTRALFPNSDGSALRSDELMRKSSLVLSGSRGIGGVVSSSSGSLDLFDLEEDEEKEDEEALDRSISFDNRSSTTPVE